MFLCRLFTGQASRDCAGGNPLVSARIADYQQLDVIDRVAIEPAGLQFMKDHRQAGATREPEGISRRLDRRRSRSRGRPGVCIIRGWSECS